MNKDKLSIILMIIPIIISTIVLFAGEGIMERFSKPKIAMYSDIVQPSFPTKIGEQLKTSQEKVPDIIRIIRIENVGLKSSENLILNLNLGGEIIEYIVDSNETIDEKVLEDDKLRLVLPRLSKNAVVDIKVWVRGDSKEFKVSYVDDINNLQLEEYQPSNISYFTVVWTMILFVSLILLVIIYLRIQNKKLIKERDMQSIQLKNELISILLEIFNEEEGNDNRGSNPPLQQETELPNGNNRQERLRAMIDSVSNL